MEHSNTTGSGRAFSSCLDFNKGLLLLYALLALTRVYGELDYFLSRVSILTRDIDIANLSVRPSVRP